MTPTVLEGGSGRGVKCEQWLVSEVTESELENFLRRVKKGGILPKSACDEKRRIERGKQLDGVATRCCLERRIVKSLEHRTADDVAHGNSQGRSISPPIVFLS